MKFREFEEGTDSIHSFIFSYNRIDLLRKAHAELSAFSRVTVIDDCSDFPIPSDMDMHRTVENQGKVGFWKLWRVAFHLAKESDATYFIFTADDLLDWKGSEVIRGIRKLPERSVINFFRDQRDTCWIGLPPIDYGYFRQICFVDCAVLIPRDVLELMDYHVDERPKDYPHRSSGVGRAMSFHMDRLDIRIMQPKKSWVDHYGNECSVMHKGKRNFKAVR